MEAFTEHLDSAELSAAAHGRSEPRRPINGRYCEFFCLSALSNPLLSLIVCFLFTFIAFSPQNLNTTKQFIWRRHKGGRRNMQRKRTRLVVFAFNILWGLHDYIRTSSANEVCLDCSELNQLAISLHFVHVCYIHFILWPIYAHARVFTFPIEIQWAATWT